MTVNTNDKQGKKVARAQNTGAFAQIRPMELEQIKKMSIVEILREWGHEPVRVSGNRAHYLSPIRTEKNPSFVVYEKEAGDDWYDYGSHEGGSIIDLTMRFWQISYVDAVRMLRKRLHIPVRQWVESLR